MESAEPPEPEKPRPLSHELAILVVLSLVLGAISCWGLEHHPPLSPPPPASVP